jgi:hypothetical protein
MRSKERTGQPMTSRTHAQPVWVDLAVLFGRTGGSADGIDISQPAHGGLIKWLRTSGGGWVDIVNLVVTMTDGSTVRFAEQLVPSNALRPR